MPQLNRIDVVRVLRALDPEERTDGLVRRLVEAAVRDNPAYFFEPIDSATAADFLGLSGANALTVRRFKAKDGRAAAPEPFYRYGVRSMKYRRIDLLLWLDEQMAKRGELGDFEPVDPRQRQRFPKAA